MQITSSAGINKQKHTSRIVAMVAGLALFIAIVIQSSLITIAAGSATLTLSSSSNAYTVGDSFSVTIRENSGSDPVNAVQADLSYDSSKLQYLSTNVSSSVFNLAGPSSGGSGSVSIARTKDGGAVTGTQTVAVVNFKATAAGSATISFKTSSSIVRNTDYTNVWNGSTAGATYTINPVATPPPSNPPSSGGSSSNSGGNSSSSKPSTSSPSASGSTNNSNTSSPSSTPDTSKPNPDNNTNQPTSESSSSEEPATDTSASGQYTVGIKVLDAKNKPVVGAKVTINGQTQITDDTGVAGFTDMPEGDYKAEIEYDGKKISSDVSVKGASTSLQEFTVSIDGKKDSGSNLLVIGGIGLAAVAAIVGGFFLTKYLKNRKINNFYKYQSANDVDVKPMVVQSNPDQAPGTVVNPQPQVDQNNDEQGQ